MDGFDAEASPELAQLAHNLHGLSVRVETFEALDAPQFKARYHGVWANFSLLHAPKAQFPSLIRMINTSLKADGAFHLGMKLGDGEGRDELGRFFAYYSEAELWTILAKGGFLVRKSWRGNGFGLANAPDTYITLSARKLDTQDQT